MGKVVAKTAHENIRTLNMVVVHGFVNVRKIPKEMEKKTQRNNNKKRALEKSSR